MKTITLKIKNKQYMEHIVPVLQTNTIYNKRIPGIGATTLEINSERNSILILPFLPVIEGKCLDENGRLRTDIIGVCGYKNIDDVIDYLDRRGNQKKKILCTPEKFEMVLQAIRDEGGNPFKDYFLLIDECETMIKDVDYRPKIKAPLKYFFQFKNKAMISATPITPRDARFDYYGFKYVKIEPHRNRKYKVDLELLGTNNVVSVLRQYIQEHPEETLCIFTNCSKTITKIINDLNLHNEAKVFCAHRLLVKRFKVTGVSQAYTSLNDSKDGLAKVNFFTSRFFCAVDMVFPEIKPHVIMVTNLYYSDHSQIDPATDAIQISGRFRKGIAKMVHISNFNPDIPNKSYAEIKKEDEEIMLLYKHLVGYREAQPENKARLSAVDTILEDAVFASVMTDGVYDIYLADNRLHQNMVSVNYCYYNRLKAMYEKVKYFNLSGKYESRRVTDDDIMRKDAVAGASRRKAVAEALHKFHTENGPFNLDLSYYPDLQEFFYMDEIVFTAYFELGIEFMQLAKYKLKKIKQGLLNLHKAKLKVKDQIISAVYIEFVKNQTVTNNEAKLKLQAIYDTYLSEPITARGTDMRLYFETTELHNIVRNGVGQRGYRLGNHKHAQTIQLADENAHLNQFNF